MHPPARASSETHSAAEWKIDMDELKKAITPKTRMIVSHFVENIEEVSPS